VSAFASWSPLILIARLLIAVIVNVSTNKKPQEPDPTSTEAYKAQLTTTVVAGVREESACWDLGYSDARACDQYGPCMIWRGLERSATRGYGYHVPRFACARPIPATPRTGETKSPAIAVGDESRQLANS
jgi:hypothetical protein